MNAQPPDGATAPARADDLSLATLAWLRRAGVTDVVLCPGSRNAPLALALWALAQAGGVRLHTRIDERTAGFLALGLTKGSAGGPRAAVLTTSGTAVANLHPAVLEATHAGIGLIVLSADRPARLRGTGANQTTAQAGIFGPLVVSHDVADIASLDAVAAPPGEVVHLNLQLDAPLVPDEPPTLAVAELPPIAPPPDVRRGAEAGALTLPRGARTVVVAGDDAGPAARRLAEAAGWPLLAEPSSGSRTGEHALRTYRLLLGTALGEAIERVVVFGRPTLSRPVTRLLESGGTGPGAREVLVVPGRGAWPVSPPGARVLPAPPVWSGEPDDPAWLAAWRDTDRHLGRRLDALLAGEGFTPYAVAGVVHGALPAGGLLTVGASSPIRDLDLMARPTPVGSRRRVIANRGLAGIDGTVSTAIGAALGRESSRSLALMGDLTFLHDQTALVLGPHEPRPELTIVVANDDGGAIFSVLEQGAPAHAASFERLFGTPHGHDLASLCAAARVPHLRATSRPELEQAIASPNGGIEVVEAVFDRSGRRDLDARIRALAGEAAAVVDDALRGVLGPQD